MTQDLTSIAARYASAFKRSEMFSPADGHDRPTTIDIWLWELESAVMRNAVEHRKIKPDTESYDHFCLYAHYDCLQTPEDVQRAPDRVLFEALGLTGNEWGWLQFMTREHLWFSLISANWGHPTLLVGEFFNLATKDQRRAEVVSHFLNLTQDRGDNPLPGIKSLAEALKAVLAEQRGEQLTEEAFTAWLHEQNELFYWVYFYADNPNPPMLLTPAKEPEYTGADRARFASKIRQAAERRRQYWNAPYSCDCKV